jgi:phosphoglycerate dehydrogenase-like enzyme
MLVGGPLTVHMPDPPDDERFLRSMLDPNVRLVIGESDAVCSERDVLVQGVPSREDIEASPRLRALVIPWSGLPGATRKILLDRPDIEVYNIHHNAAPAAELAIALLLAAAKRIVPMDRALRASDWRPRYGADPSMTLDGKAVLVLGYGAIGRRVAAACRGLGMRTLAVRRGPGPSASDAPDDVYPVTELDDLLPRVSAVVVAVPLTDETSGFIDERRLSLLPEGAVLVNVARGRVVDEGALYKALASGRLGAAGIDVWYRYPESEEDRSCTAPAGHPFHELDNIVMSPHRGGAFAASDTERRRVEALAVVLNALARGGSVPNRVGVVRGY